MRFVINPQPKPRMTHKGRFSPKAKRYYAYSDELRTLCLAMRFELGETFHVVFNMPMPKSWSQKKRNAMRGEPHKSRPDLSNLLKAVEDILMEEDSCIYTVVAQKKWADEGSIQFMTISESSYIFSTN